MAKIQIPNLKSLFQNVFMKFGITELLSSTLRKSSALPNFTNPFWNKDVKIQISIFYRSGVVLKRSEYNPSNQKASLNNGEQKALPIIIIANIDDTNINV